LNSVKFLNSTLFKNNPLTEPLITYEEFLLFIATVVFLITAYMLLFVGERIIEHNTNQLNCKKLAAVVPRFFTRSTIVKLIFYIMGMRVLRYMINATVAPKLTRLGFSRADMANVDTVLFPAYFLISLLGIKKLLVEGRLMKLYHFMAFVCAVLVLLKYFIILDIQNNGAFWRAFCSYAVVLFIEKFAARPVYLASFVNTMAPIEIGSTFVALFVSIGVATQSVPTSMGLWLEDHIPVSYATFVLVPLSVQFIIIAATARYAIGLDSVSKEEFDVTKDNPPLEEINPLLRIERTPIVGEPGSISNLSFERETAANDARQRQTSQ